ncbi:hypothetical protein BDW66DRAFT_148603 [Aspergillus desertorum]
MPSVEPTQFSTASTATGRPGAVFVDQTPAALKVLQEVLEDICAEHAQRDVVIAEEFASAGPGTFVLEVASAEGTHPVSQGDYFFGAVIVWF